MKVKAADGHELEAYVARPVGVPRGGVVVVQEIFGVNGQIRQVADDLAALGYLAAAPALFDRYERGVELTDEGEDLKRAFGEFYPKLKPETALLDVAAAFTAVQVEAEKVAVLGFCFGGLMAWLAATRGPGLGMKPACCVGYYPGGIGSFATETPSCPVLLHFGGADSHIGPEQREAVHAAHPDVNMFVYEGAEHAFAGTARTAYDPTQAGLAVGRTQDFLKRNVG